MRGLSSLERIILECIGKQSFTYDEILSQSGLHQNVCFNVLQALIIRGIVSTNGIHYQIKETLSPLMLEEVNGLEAKHAETLELLEAVLNLKSERIFRFQKVAMDSHDEKIFIAMLSNLETFLIDAHKKSHKRIPMKERKLVFWGMGQVSALMNQIIIGE
jgi:hypothetical protein